jgi:hypothetical protein
LHQPLLLVLPRLRLELPLRQLVCRLELLLHL